jgi:hypothetical protein
LDVEEWIGPSVSGYLVPPLEPVKLSKVHDLTMADEDRLLVFRSTSFGDADHVEGFESFDVFFQAPCFEILLVHLLTVMKVSQPTGRLAMQGKSVRRIEAMDLCHDLHDLPELAPMVPVEILDPAPVGVPVKSTS